MPPSLKCFKNILCTEEGRKEKKKNQTRQPASKSKQTMNVGQPLFCLSIARIRSNSTKSEGLIGLDIEVIGIPRLLEAPLILGSA